MHEAFMNGGTSFSACRCCGEAAVYAGNHPQQWRCGQHKERNPCAIHGCSRTTAAKGGLHCHRTWICGTHWRIVCPPRSRQRRLVNAHFRRAKKLGVSPGDRWPENLERSYWRMWDRLLKRADEIMEGDVDMTEINKMFGWADA